MWSLARHIRNRHFDDVISKLEDEGASSHINETSGESPTRGWIDEQEDAWNSVRQQVQYLEYQKTDPPSQNDVRSARAFMVAMPLGTTAEQAVARWEAKYQARKQNIEAELSRIRTRLADVDPRSDDFDRGMQHVRHLEHRLWMLPYQNFLQ